MRIHQRTKKEQDEIFKKASTILKEQPWILVEDLAKRFGLSNAGLSGILKRGGFNPRKKDYD